MAAGNFQKLMNQGTSLLQNVDQICVLLCLFVCCRQIDIQSGTVSRLGSKLKGAIRGAIDGATLEAAEVPTVWDAFTDETQVWRN